MARTDLEATPDPRPMPAREGAERPRGAGAGPRDAGTWAVTPADVQRAVVFGDRGLGDLLTACGLAARFEARPRRADAAERTGAQPVVFVSLGRPPSRKELREALSWLEEAGAVVVDVPGLEEGDPEYQSRHRRVLLMLRSLPAAGSARLALRGARRQLGRAGFEVCTIATGDRSRRHALAADVALWRRRRLARGAIVLGWLEDRPETVLERATGEAAVATEARLRAVALSGLPAGVLLAELVDPAGRRYFLRVAGGEAAALAQRSHDALEALLGEDPPESVRERLPAPVACGRAGPARFTLEAGLGGHQPRRMTATLWSDALEFLCDLGRTPPAGGGPARASVVASMITDDVATLRPHAGAGAGETLDALEQRLPLLLEHVRPVWGHGDFWPPNLLAQGGRLAGVLDWDAAGPDHLPALDLFHLTALSDPRVRRLPHGGRCTQGLWPLARAGGDDRVRRYCEATGTPEDASTLEALAIAYWLTRVARDLRTFSDRARRPRWLEANLHQPLEHLAARRW